MPQSKQKTGFRGPSPEVGKATQFKPGQSGNPGGRPKRKPFLEEIEKWIAAHPEDITKAVKQAFQKAKDGDLPYLRELMDRVDGTVKQQVEHTGDDGGPIEHTIRFGNGKRSTE